MFIAPSLAPLHEIAKPFVFGTLDVEVSSVGSSITYVFSSVHPLSSVTTTLYVPGERSVWSAWFTFNPVPPVLVDHWYV